MRTSLKIIISSLIFVSSAAVSAEIAADIQSTILTELGNIETQTDSCAKVISTNKLIRLGEAAVEDLGGALTNPNVGLQSKWSVALALGEIGSAKAIPALTAATKDANPWLRDNAKGALSIIRGESKRTGKVFLMTYAVQNTRTDCETGVVEVILN